jgi:hypothetical protein
MEQIAGIRVKLKCGAHLHLMQRRMTQDYKGMNISQYFIDVTLCTVVLTKRELG